MLTRWDLEELYHEEDNELMHYGVKGMHWGKHLPGVDILNAAIAKARAGATNLRNELNGTNAYNKGVARANAKNRAINREIAKTRSTRTDPGADRYIHDLQAKQAKNTAEATSSAAKRSAYENSIEGKLKKFASNTIKSLKYNASKATKSLSKSLNKHANKTLSSLKKTANEFAKGYSSGGNDTLNRLRGYSTTARTGAKLRNKVNKASKSISNAAKKYERKREIRNFTKPFKSASKSFKNSISRAQRKSNTRSTVQNLANRVGYRTKTQKRVSSANRAVNRYYQYR